MDRSVKRWTLGVAGGLAVTTALAIGAVVAFACIPISMLNLSPNTVSPGQSVTASIQAISVNPGQTAPPVTFHWQTLNGPALATATPGEFGTTATFKVPSVSQSGDYLVIATQQQATGSSTWGMPARAVLHVTVNGSTPANSSSAAGSTTSNTAGLATSSALSPGILALIGIGVAAVAISLVGLATWGVARVSPRAQKVGRR
jgi:hypothetical protein